MSRYLAPLFLILVFAAAGCVLETDLARREGRDSADGAADPSCTSDGDACAIDAEADAETGMDHMSGAMDGPMDCDGADCDGAAVNGTDTGDGMAMP